MKIPPINYESDPQMRQEIDMAEARRQAKDMACIRYCGDGKSVKGTIHVMACPYWDPFKRRNNA